MLWDILIFFKLRGVFVLKFFVKLNLFCGIDDLNMIFLF